jgi:ElaB/YqjD/DUF883 family membrane-anchored ribosome-binding protein
MRMGMELAPSITIFPARRPEETDVEYTQTQPQSNPMMDNEGMLDSTRERLNETLQDVTARLQEAASYADQQVQSRPWAAVGVGFGFGMVMGALLMLVARR